MTIRKLCPNVEKENGLETVLEVPIPEEMFVKMGGDTVVRWHNMRALMKAQFQPNDNNNSYRGDKNNDNAKANARHLQSKSDNEFLALLKLVGAPLIPFQLPLDKICVRSPLLNHQQSIEASSAKYIMEQYIATTGGQQALSAMGSMYAVGQVKMVGSAEGDESVPAKGNVTSGREAGGFVLWQKNPDLWYLELIVAGFKVSAGSNGKVAWNQLSSQPGHATRGPPRLLRRFFQGLDPRCTAGLFSDAVCIGEKPINRDHCFILKVETSSSALRAQSSANTEIVHHTIWGYFSHRTGLLIKLEDTKLVKMNPPRGHQESIFWEATMESFIEDYQSVHGINIAHRGKTITHLHRYGESRKFEHKRQIEETWRIEEVDFNICGLSMDHFLPPADLMREQEG